MCHYSAGLRTPGAHSVRPLLWCHGPCSRRWGHHLVHRPGVAAVGMHCKGDSCLGRFESPCQAGNAASCPDGALDFKIIKLYTLAIIFYLQRHVCAAVLRRVSGLLLPTEWLHGWGTACMHVNHTTRGMQFFFFFGTDWILLMLNVNIIVRHWAGTMIQWQISNCALWGVLCLWHGRIFHEHLFLPVKTKKSPKLDFLQHSEVFGYFCLVHIFVHTFPQLGLVRIVEIEQ